MPVSHAVPLNVAPKSVVSQSMKVVEVAIAMRRLLRSVMVGVVVWSVTVMGEMKVAASPTVNVWSAAETMVRTPAVSNTGICAGCAACSASAAPQSASAPPSVAACSVMAEAQSSADI